MSHNLVPISDAQAQAITEALKTLQGIGGFLREMFGTVPEDIVGLLGGDLLKVRRAENLYRTIEKARAKIEKDGIKPNDAARLRVSLPILIAAADESDDELQEL